MDLHTELLTSSTPLLRGHRDYSWIIKLFTETRPGAECIWSSAIRFKVSRSRVHFWDVQRRLGYACYVNYADDERHCEADERDNMADIVYVNMLAIGFQSSCALLGTQWT